MNQACFVFSFFSTSKCNVMANGTLKIGIITNGYSPIRKLTGLNGKLISLFKVEGDVRPPIVTAMIRSNIPR